MSVTILHDEDQKIAVFFCTTTDRALGHQAFIGASAWDQADDFLAWSDYDPREYPKHGYSLDAMLELWHAEAFNEDDEFVGTQKPEAAA